MAQKLAPETWNLVVWERSLTWNAAGLGEAILLALLAANAHRYRHLASVAFVALALFLLPIAIFTNLHVVHEYYQVSCVVYLLAALAILIGGLLPQVTRGALSVPLLTLAMVA